MRPARPTLLAFVLILAACGDDSADVLDPTEIEFAASLDIDLDRMTRTSSGLYIENVDAGTGAVAAAGDSVGVLYSGWLPNGTLFDSGTNPANPLRFRLGVRRVISGFDEGVTGLRVGGVRKLVIPPALGYGGQANGPIPANSTLVFRVQLTNIY